MSNLHRDQWGNESYKTTSFEISLTRWSLHRAPFCGDIEPINFLSVAKEQYDQYQGIAELMPHARAASTASNDFNESGNTTHTDYHRRLKIVLDAQYHGWVNVEYEGEQISKFDGIIRTKDLLLPIRKKKEQGK